MNTAVFYNSLHCGLRTKMPIITDP